MGKFSSRLTSSRSSADASGAGIEEPWPQARPLASLSRTCWCQCTVTHGGEEQRPLQIEEVIHLVEDRVEGEVDAFVVEPERFERRLGLM